jgi:hypothetical protein
MTSMLAPRLRGIDSFTRRTATVAGKNYALNTRNTSFCAAGGFGRDRPGFPIWSIELAGLANIAIVATALGIVLGMPAAVAAPATDPPSVEPSRDRTRMKIDLSDQPEAAAAVDAARLINNSLEIRPVDGWFETKELDLSAADDKARLIAIQTFASTRRASCAASAGARTIAGRSSPVAANRKF